MNEKQIFALLRQLWKDVYSPDFYWVLLLLVMVLTLAWGLSRRLNRKLSAQLPERRGTGKPPCSRNPRSHLRWFRPE